MITWKHYIPYLILKLKMKKLKKLELHPNEMHKNFLLFIFISLFSVIHADKIYTLSMLTEDIYTTAIRVDPGEVVKIKFLMHNPDPIPITRTVSIKPLEENALFDICTFFIGQTPKCSNNTKYYEEKLYSFSSLIISTKNNPMTLQIETYPLGASPSYPFWSPDMAFSLMFLVLAFIYLCVCEICPNL